MSYGKLKMYLNWRTLQQKKKNKHKESLMEVSSNWSMHDISYTLIFPAVIHFIFQIKGKNHTYLLKQRHIIILQQWRVTLYTNNNWRFIFSRDNVICFASIIISLLFVKRSIISKEKFSLFSIYTDYIMDLINIFKIDKTV